MNLHGVLEREKFILNMGNHRCEPLQQDWKKFGAAAFEIEIAETGKPMIALSPVQDKWNEIQLMYVELVKK